MKLCECCGKASVAGYVGSGVVLEKLCLKCWKKHRHGDKEVSRKNKGHYNTGKS